jgi:DNA-binding LacI/PurR family transcriptional regulator
MTRTPVPPVGYHDAIRIAEATELSLDTVFNYLRRPEVKTRRATQKLIRAALTELGYSDPRAEHSSKAPHKEARV